jgi:hypothetical protein
VFTIKITGQPSIISFRCLIIHTLQVLPVSDCAPKIGVSGGRGWGTRRV